MRNSEIRKLFGWPSLIVPFKSHTLRSKDKLKSLGRQLSFRINIKKNYSTNRPKHFVHPVNGNGLSVCTVYECGGINYVVFLFAIHTERRRV